jgi:hypothetical protein
VPASHPLQEFTFSPGLSILRHQFRSFLHSQSRLAQANQSRPRLPAISQPIKLLQRQIFRKYSLRLLPSAGVCCFHFVRRCRCRPRARPLEKPSDVVRPNAGGRTNLPRHVPHTSLLAAHCSRQEDAALGPSEMPPPRKPGLWARPSIFLGCGTGRRLDLLVAPAFHLSCSCKRLKESSWRSHTTR